MRPYADPTRCPGCRAPIHPGAIGCDACRIRLDHPLAGRLFATLSQADDLVRALRALPVLPATPAQPAPFSPGPPELPTYPGLADAPAATPGLAPRRTTTSVIPKLLLGVGALLFFVAAALFLALTWAVVGVGVRTVLLTVIALAAAGAAALSRRKGLRNAVEAFLGLSLALVPLVAIGARTAWFPSVGTASLTIAIGAAVMALGAVAALALRHPPAYAGQVAVPVGAATVWIGLAATAPITLPAGAAIALILCTVLALAARYTHLWVAMWGLLGVASTSWTILLADGLGRAAVRTTVADQWDRIFIWPLLLCSLVPALIAAHPDVPTRGRIGLLATGTAVLTPLILVPAVTADPHPRNVALVAALVIASALAAPLPRRWRAAVAPLAIAPGLVLAWTQLGSLLAGAVRVLPDALWADPVTVRLPDAGHTGPEGPWWAPIVLLALYAAALVFTRPDRTRPDRTARTGAALGAAAALALGVFSWLTWLPTPRALFVLVLLALAVGVAWSSRRSTLRGLAWVLPTAPAALAGLAGLAALPSQALTLVVVLTVLGLSTVAVNAPAPQQRVLGEVLAPPSLAAALLIATDLLVPGELARWIAAAVTIVLLGALGLVVRRYRLEVSAWTSAAVALFVAAPTPTWVAFHLTLAGLLLGATALVRPDRRWLSWAAAAVLSGACWARLLAVDVGVVEAYTVPSAALLLAVGYWHRRLAGLRTVRALGPGLSMGLLPSLLVVVEDPVSWRAAALGAVALALALGGAAARWLAPLVFGAGTLLLLGIREFFTLPFLYQWPLLALAGVVMVVVGVTWDRRLADVRRTSSFLIEMD